MPTKKAKPVKRLRRVKKLEATKPLKNIDKATPNWRCRVLYESKNQTGKRNENGNQENDTEKDQQEQGATQGQEVGSNKAVDG